MNCILAEGIEPLKEVINLILKDKQKRNITPKKDAQTEELLTSQIANEYAREDTVRLYNQKAKEILSELEQEKVIRQERGV